MVSITNDNHVPVVYSLRSPGDIIAPNYYTRVSSDFITSCLKEIILMSNSKLEFVAVWRKFVCSVRLHTAWVDVY